MKLIRHSQMQPRRKTMISSEIPSEVHSVLHEAIPSAEEDTLEILRDSISEIYSHNSDEDEEDNLRHEASSSISEISSAEVPEDRSAELNEEPKRKNQHLRNNR